MMVAAAASPRPGVFDAVPSLSSVARTYVGLVCLAGGLVLAHALARLAVEPPSGQWVVLAALTLICGPLAIRFPSQHASVSISEPLIFASALLFGPEPTVLTVAIEGALLSLRARHLSLHRLAFNIAEPACSVWGACLALTLVTGADLPLRQDVFGGSFVPLLVLIGTYFLLNGLLQLTAVSMESGRAPLGLLRGHLTHLTLSLTVSVSIVVVLVRHPSDMNVLIGGVVLPSLVLIRFATTASVRRVEEVRQDTRELAGAVASRQEALNRAIQSEAALTAERDELAIANGRLAVTVHAIGDGVITIDGSGSILLMNTAARALTGVQPGGRVGQSAGAIFSALGFAAPAFEAALRSVLVGGQTVQLRSEPGSGGRAQGPVDVTGTPTRDAQNRVSGAVWVVRDLSDAERLEQERAKAAQLESLGVLAGGLAHDLNNILVGATGSLSLARTLMRTDNVALSARLSEAEAACARATRVANQLLTFAKGGAPVKRTASVRELVVECTRFALSGSPVAPRFAVDDGLWTADVDTVQIGRAVHSLVLNALQAMPRGGVVDIELRNVELTARQRTGDVILLPGCYVQVTIQDRGPGISGSDLGRIFEPYFTTQDKGSGLGLAIAHSVVKAHGGVLTVESEPDRGARLSLYLPASVR